MGIIRDFSEESLNNLRNIAKITNEDWNLFDWFSDTFLTEELNIHDNINDLSHYHEVVMDKYNIGEHKLNEIIENIDTIDKNYQNIFKKINEIAKLNNDVLIKLTDIIAPTHFVVDNDVLKKYFYTMNTNYNTEKLKILFGSNNFDEIISKISSKKCLNDLELVALLELIELHPNKVIPEPKLEIIINSLCNYIDNNEDSYDLTLTIVEQIGIKGKTLAEAIRSRFQIAGPEGMNSFIMYSDSSSEIIQRLNRIINNSDNLIRIGKYGGRALTSVGIGVGVWDDIFNDDKSVGEAISHQGVGLGVSALISVLMFGTNPVGWAAVGATAVSIGVGTLFEIVYNKNFLGIQDGLDWLGSKIDGIFDWTWNGLSDLASDIGEGIQSLGETINPFNWF